MSNQLDHGVLNLPLNKRGFNLDKDIENYKKEQARLQQVKNHERYARNAQRENDAIPVKAVYEALTTKQLRVAAKKYNTTVTDLRILIKTEIKYKPKRAQEMINLVIKASEELNNEYQ